MSDLCCSMVRRINGTYHSRWCPTYPNVLGGTEHLLDAARAGKLRSEIHKAALRSQEGCYCDLGVGHCPDHVDDDGGEQAV